MEVFSKNNYSNVKIEAIGNDYGLIDYDFYKMSKKQWCMNVIIAAVILSITGYIFYHSIIMAVILSSIAFFYPAIRRKQIIERRKERLNLQFKDMLYSLSSSLSVGKSVETALKNALKEMVIIYPNPETEIIKELEYMIRKLDMNETVEVVLESFAKRSHLEDVENFVEVFRTCKRTGGDIVEVIKNSSTIINDKIDVKHDIEVLLSARKFEQKLLSAMPVALILLLTFSAGDYMEPLFRTLQGKAAMTFSIFLLIIAYKISQKIMDIKV